MFELYAVFLILMFIIPAIFCLCKRRRQYEGRVIQAAPVVVTTATQQVPFTPSQPMQHTIIQSGHSPYPMAQQGYPMPMPPNQHSYPIPQPGYHPYPSGGAPYPPAGPHESMNPPSYDQVVGTMTTTTTNETYAKQAPYNPSFTG